MPYMKAGAGKCLKAYGNEFIDTPDALDQKEGFFVYHLLKNNISHIEENWSVRDFAVFHRVVCCPKNTTYAVVYGRSPHNPLGVNCCKGDLHQLYGVDLADMRTQEQEIHRIYECRGGNGGDTGSRFNGVGVVTPDWALRAPDSSPSSSSQGGSTPYVYAEPDSATSAFGSEQNADTPALAELDDGAALAGADAAAFADADGALHHLL